VSSLDSKIDALYELPLSGFTSARNALAKTLSGEEAARIKQLPKPTVVAWAINQLYWKERPVYQRLEQTGRTLRDAQLAVVSGKGDRGAVQRAAQTHRKALADAVHHTSRLADASGLKPDADALARMLEALSLSPAPPATPGRLADLLRPAGFEALAGITPAPARLRGVEKVDGDAGRDDADSKRAGRAEAARQRRDEIRRREAAAVVKTLEDALAQARRRESAARRALDRAEEDVRVADERVKGARSRLKDLG
jgi:hypothetical protein